MEAKEFRIHAIDGLRGVAALCVAVLHYQTWFVGAPVAVWNNIATQLFFVLSGYILTRKYADGLRSGSISMRTFVVHRVSRLWPLHIFTLLLFVATEWLFWNYYGRVHVLNADDSAYAFVLNALMIHNWGFDIQPAFNKPSWSISSELAVNLLWAPLLIYGRWTSVGALIVIAACSVLMCLASVPLNYNVYNTVFGISYGILRTAVGFALGCLICWHAERWRMPTVLSGAIQIVLLLALAFFSALEPFGIDWLFSLVLLPGITIVALTHGTVAAWLMSSPPFRWLGRLSYSVYLLHVPIGNLLTLPILWGYGLPPHPYLGIAWLTIVLAASTVSFYLIELKGMDFMRAALSRRTTRALEVAD